jgi:hypothetical protein
MAVAQELAGDLDGEEGIAVAGGRCLGRGG